MAPASAYKLSNYLETARAPNSSTGQEALLVFSTRSGQLLRVPGDLWESLQKNELDSLAPGAIEGLVAAELLVPANGDERWSLTETSRAATRNTRTLTRMILPTAYCQMGCFYCGQEHAQKTMSSETVNALVDDIRISLSTGNFDRLLITWFGGEPTTAPEAVRELSHHFLEICRELGVKYESRMITNGLGLHVPLARMLVHECRVTVFTISVDGPERIHDSRRATKTGKGTFARIMRNLKDIAACPDLSDCSIHIRVNIDADNAPYVHQLIEILADAGLAKRVEVDLAVVVPWTLHENPDFIERKSFGDMEIGWFGHLLSRGFRVKLLPSPRASACLAAEPTSAVVTTEGALHNCALTPMALHEITRTTQPVGTLKAHDISEGIKRHDEVFNLITTPEIPCYSCKYLFLCQGSCPKDIEKGLLNCPGYKFNLPARMSLHYLMKVRRESQQEKDIVFDFSPAGLDSHEAVITQQRIEADIERFSSRFAMFRPPDEIVLYPADFRSDIETLEQLGSHIRWNYRLSSPAYDSLTAITGLAECYLHQINLDLWQRYTADDDAEAGSMARAFMSWTSTLLLHGYEAAGSIATDDMRDAINEVARSACIEHFMAQPIPTLINHFHSMRTVHAN